jgi:ATP-dependent helicase/nuclease subunit A
MNLLQLKASNPELSVWVSASAGTGKTKILTDRVLRLLLKGEPFGKILCLTFTNAAASEMQERITHSLEQWAKLDNERLAKKLQQLLGTSCTQDELLIAKKLYSSYITLEDNINIQTLHSFCQKLLKKFPLESGVSPGFRIIDEIKASSILKQIKGQLTSQPELKLINEYLTINFHGLIIDEILSEIIQQKSKFQRNNSNIKEIYSESEKLINHLQKNFEDDYQELKNNSLVQHIIGFDVTVSELKKFFLTATGQKKKRIVAQKIAKPGSSLYSDLEIIQEQVYILDQKEKSSRLENHSKLLSLLGAKILSEYEFYKSKRGLLDYDDLIIKACALLNNNQAREKDMYKLDGFINHLLVDEAQDTSGDQWRIVDALIAEFYSGDSITTKNERTVFVVGDEKQSIFSFQGAEVAYFGKMNKLLSNKISSAGKSFENINLEISYRSAKEILEIVYHVFDKIQKQIPGMFANPINQLTAFRDNYPGKVELWPLSVAAEEQEEFWPITSQNSKSTVAKTLLAEKISLYIKNRIDRGNMLPATGKAITSGDFMILFRKRDELTKEVIKALQDQGLQVSGLDRITLKGNLSVQDLLSIGRFVLNPLDDLNLATLLKAPIIGLDEQSLQDLTIARGKLSIWQNLCNKIDKEQKYYNLYSRLNMMLEIYDKTSLSTFYQYIVDVLGIREQLNTLNGPDSDDAINELLYICRDYENQGDGSLQSFLFWVDESESSIKRNNNFLSTIKIMTAHASKGLQSPVVILCDTTSLPNNADRFIWNKENNFLSAKNSKEAPEYYNEIKKLEQDKTYAEYLRLLYVGMTRAEDHLIICGYEGSKTISEYCWYELVKKSMNEIATENKDGILLYGQDDENNLNIENPSVDQEQNNTELFYPQPRNDTQYILGEKASSTGYNNKTPISMRALDDVTKYQSIGDSPLSSANPREYGRIFHKIMEDSINLNNITALPLHPLIETLDSKQQVRIKKSIEKIIANKTFCELVKNNTVTEISIGSMPEKSINLGRIDLMIKTGKQLVIIDYKSDTHPPVDQENVPLGYKDQLFMYRDIIQDIYPSSIVSIKILWLANGVLMDI